MTTATMTVNATTANWAPGYKIQVDLASGVVSIVTPERPEGVAADDGQLPRAILDAMTEEAQWRIGTLRELIDAD